MSNYILTFLCLFISSLSAQTVREIDLSSHFTDIEGTFLLLKNDTLFVHNPERAEQEFLPASTFKIPNTIIALEEGIADSSTYYMEWDSVKAPPSGFWPRAWRQGHTLKTAFRNSVVWYYQEIARRVGSERMREYLERFDYGNRSTEGGIDRFWLAGGLRITPMGQLKFIKELTEGACGISERTLTILHDIMLTDSTSGYKIYSKTGTADVTKTRELGWLTGYIDTAAGRSFFIINIEGETVWEQWPPDKRVQLLKNILNENPVMLE